MASFSSVDALPVRDAPGLDPASAGDPFERVRYRYGMLLGADDFTAEQRYHVLRRRLHNALVHGGGVLWGLGLERAAEGAEVRVATGWAVDALGRDIYLNAPWCLDVRGIASNPVWNALPVDGAARIAVIALRYRAIESQPVPAIRPTCSEPADAVAWSRVIDNAAISLEGVAPPTPMELLETWLAPPLRSPAPLWDATTEAPLMLGTVQLVSVDGEVRVASVDNGGRTMGASVAGALLTGSLRVRKIDLRPGGANLIRVALTAPADTRSIANAAEVRVLGDTGWTTVATTAAAGTDANAPTLEVSVAGIAEGALVQVRVRGAGEAPLVDQDGSPLSGFLDEATLPPGRGRDVNWTGRWEV